MSHLPNLACCCDRHLSTSLFIILSILVLLPPSSLCDTHQLIWLNLVFNKEDQLATPSLSVNSFHCKHFWQLRTSSSLWPSLMAFILYDLRAKSTFVCVYLNWFHFPMNAVLRCPKSLVGFRWVRNKDRVMWQGLAAQADLRPLGNRKREKGDVSDHSKSVAKNTNNGLFYCPFIQENHFKQINNPIPVFLLLHCSPDN